MFGWISQFWSVLDYIQLDYWRKNFDFIMNSFVFLIKYLRICGIIPWNFTLLGRIITLIINFIFFGGFFMLFYSTLWFFLFEAVTFSEFSESFYYLNCSFLMTSWYTTYLFKREKFIGIFEKLNNIIEKRK